MSGYTYLVAFTANLISFSAGTGITWPSPEIKKLQNDATIQMTFEEGTWVSSLFSLGAIVGPFIYGMLTGAIGKKNTIVILGVQFTSCYLLMSFIKHVAAFYVGRFIFGIGFTGVLTVLPMYLAEIAPTKNRGIITSLLSVFLSTGELFSYCLGPYSSILVFNLTLALIPAASTVGFFLVAPESAQSANVGEELLEIEKITKKKTSRNFLKIFKSKGTFKSFYITLGLFIFHQLTGIEAVLMYAQTIFENAGTSLEPAKCSMILGASMLFSSIIAPLVVERVGRKKLLLTSYIGICFSELPLGIYTHLKNHGTNVDAISFLPVICMMLTILSFSLGVGTISWTILSELFSDEIKTTASPIILTINSTLGFFIAKYFESLSIEIGMGVCFMIFSGLSFTAVVFVWIFLIETGGKTFEEIQKELND